MTKIVINRCYGGFGLSPLAQKRYLELSGKGCYFYKQMKYEHLGDEDEYVRISIKDAESGMFVYTLTEDLGEKITKLPRDDTFWYDGNLERTDPILIQVVEELGEEASDKLAELEIVNIPDDIEWQIDEYDGYESVHEKHRSW